MSELLCVKHSIFSSEMQEEFDKDEEITSINVFDTFVRTLAKSTNVLSEEKLKGLVFRQFKSYGDFDETMTEVAENVSGIKQSTQDALLAIDKQDSGALKSAYNQLKSYEKRILELEEDIYTDDLTGIYNRKYLLNHELSKEGQFKADGMLLHISINNFEEINKEHGYESGDVVLKYVSKICQKNLKSVGVNLVRYLGIHFVAVVKESVSVKAVNLCQSTVDMILSKKFKTSTGEVLNIELQFCEVRISKGDGFQEVYEGL
ncbi:MAG: hypothetical protein COA44_13580 [Arcobacter sp.]|nr:MAG: hypothetical protein COA44_13580 [Arcobacter sp.]